MPTYAPETLEIGLTLRVYGNPKISYDELILDMFNEEAGDLPKSLEKRLYDLYVKHQKLIVYHRGKDFIANFVKNGKTELIKHFLDRITNREERKIFDVLNDTEEIRDRLENLEKLDQNRDTFKFFRRYFNDQMRVFVKTDLEDEFRRELKEWLISGELNQEIWTQVQGWYKKGAKLKEFLNLKWKVLPLKDLFVQKLLKLARRITTDEFFGHELVQKMLDHVLRDPVYKNTKDKLIVTGGTIFLDPSNHHFPKSTKSRTKQIEVYADHCVSIVNDITLPEVNLVISTNKVRVWDKSRINLSGKSFNPNKSKARNADDCGENGVNGENGRPGGSSGNLTILTRQIIGQELLEIILNGGRGEDGEDGGDGYNGEDGQGIEWSEMKKIGNFYNSLYCGFWSTFTGFSPSHWSKEYENWDKNAGEGYVYKRFTDEYGRKLTFSYAGISFGTWSFTQYHLFLWVEGAEGEKGTKGGLNGVGGEGGYKGECLVMNPETRLNFSVTVTRMMGENGQDGVIGKAGRSGNRGNDLVIIDSSGGDLIYLGDTKSRLKMDFYRSEGARRRFFGYRRHYEEEGAAFVKFENGGELHGPTIYSTTAQSQRNQSSKAVAQNAIITEEVMERTRENCQGESGFEESVSLQLSDEQEEAEAEQEEEQSVEQVVVLRQSNHVNLSQYTEESLKKERPKLTANKVLSMIKKCGRHGMISAQAQCLFDLFEVEIDWKYLENLRFPTLFQKNHFVQAIRENSLQMLLIAINQNQVQDGKTFKEIQDFANSLAYRRKLKFEMTEERHTTSQMIHALEFEDKRFVNSNEDFSFKIEKDLIEGYQEGEEMIIDKTTLNHFIQDVHENFLTFYTENDELVALAHFINNLPKVMKVMISNNFKNPDFIWSNGDGEGFMNAFLSKPKEMTEKQKRDGHDDGKEGEEGGSNDVSDRTQPVPLISKEQKDKFHNLINTIKSNIEKLEESVSHFRDLFSKDDKNKRRRYGEIPKFLKEDPNKQEKKGKWMSRLKNFVSKNEEDFEGLAVFMIKAYFISLEVLPFNRRLYNCNYLSWIDAGNLQAIDRFVNEVEDPDYTHFINQIQKQPLELDDQFCEKQMKTRVLSSSAILYLKALRENQKISKYKANGYQQLKLENIFLPLGKSTSQLVLYTNENKCYPVESNIEFNKFITAQGFVIDSMKQISEIDHSIEIPRSIESFFEPELHEIITEWIEGFLVVTNYQPLIRFLNERFFIDGCHLSIFEFQFVLSTFIYLQTNYRANLEFLLASLSTVSQSVFVDILLFIRLCYLYERRMENKIWHNLKFIQNPRHKIIFALKLSEYEERVSPDLLYKLILMLQHSATDSDKLENLSMEMWIDIAQKQTWSEIGSMMKEFGSAGYYLGVLESKGFTEEREKLSEVLNEVKFIPERLLGKYVNWISHGEFEDNMEALEALKDLKSGDDWVDEEKPIENRGKRAMLLTDEGQQDRFLEFLGLDWTFGEGNERSIESLGHLVIGMHDEKEEEGKEKNARIKEKVQQSCNELKSLDEGSPDTETCKILKRFDEHLKKLHGITLRSTQKMAVICSVDGGESVLEQVNTGEGKSFIIAAIAVVRCLRDKGRVDIITSSPVLAQRDAETMRSLYEKFGLTVGHNCSETIEDRKKAYACDIVYGDIQRFQRDYLLQTFYKKTILGNRFRDVVIVDEVDNMLLDNGNNILYLSHEVPCLDILESTLINILKRVRTPIFNGVKGNVDEIKRQFDTEYLIEQVLVQIFGQITRDDIKYCIPNGSDGNQLVDGVYKMLVQKQIIDNEGYLMTTSKKTIKSLEDRSDKSIPLLVMQKVIASLLIILDRKVEVELPMFLRPFVKLHLRELVENCKKALLMEADNEYVVDYDRTSTSTLIEPAITIIDSNTGADLPTTQWTGGLHQFLQLKHGCRLSPMSLKAVFVSNVAYLKGYRVISGLSGTLGSSHESKTLVDMYDAALIRIPPFRRKLFYENCPVITTRSNDWSKSIYDEVCDQIHSGRSILVICDSIAQAKLLQTHLDGLYQSDKDRSIEKKNCFEKITMYMRSHDQFTFEGETALEPGRLLVATNLAGRGTDIKLNKDLERNGGLHVITAFMPRNARIEEQAFGRAARCGQPGSAQIIALLQEKDGIKPSFFQFKMFRDNLEVQRLAELKVFYEYHTAIEEGCLEKFRKHCSDVLSEVYSSKTTTNIKIPSPREIIYFALLDKWAMWLDEKGPIIEQCSKNNDEEERERQKDSIIDSVQSFLSNHVLEVEKAISNWLDFPQSLINLALFKMCNKALPEADRLFDKVIDIDPHFSAEAYYYKAGMRMPMNGIEDSSLSDLGEAEKLFHFARTLFKRRLDNGDREVATVLKLVNESHDCIRSSGFEAQSKSISSNLQLILSNIDWLIGAPCDPNMFISKDIDKETSQRIHGFFHAEGHIAPPVFINYSHESWMIKELHGSFAISHQEFRKTLEGAKMNSLVYYRDPNVAHLASGIIPKEDDQNAFCCAILPVLHESVQLSDRQGFYTELFESGVVKNVKQVQYINPIHEAEAMKVINEKQMMPIKSENYGHYLLLNNSWDGKREYYEKGLSEALEGKMLDEFIGEIDVKAMKNFSYFSNFDGVTATELGDYFDLGEVGTAWILRSLEENGVLEHQVGTRIRFTEDQELWTSKIEVLLDDNRDDHVMDMDCQIVSDELRDKILKLYNEGAEKQKLNAKKVLANGTHQQNGTSKSSPSNGTIKTEKLSLNNQVQVYSVDVNENSRFFKLNQNELDSKLQQELVAKLDQLGTKRKRGEEEEILIDMVKIKKYSPDELLKKAAPFLQRLRGYKGIEHVSMELLKHVTEIEDDQQAQQLQKLLLDQKLLEEYVHSIFRLDARLDVSSLSAAISDQVAFYLFNKFAYSFALEKLCVDIDSNDPLEKAHYHAIFLPEFPVKQYFECLKSSGILMSSRIVTKGYLEIDDDQFENQEKVMEVMREKATKLLDQTAYHLTMIPMETYVQKRGETMNPEMKFLMDGGMKLMIGVAEGNLGWSILTNIVGGTVSAVKMAAKAVKAVGSFLYSVGSSVMGFIGSWVVDPIAKGINWTANKIEKGVKRAATAVADAATAVVKVVTESKAYKFASDCVKATGNALSEIGSTIGEAIGNVAYQFGEMTGINEGVRKIAAVGRAIGNGIKTAGEYIGEKAKEAWDWSKKKAGEAWDYMADTRIAKLVTEAATGVMNFVKSTYKKMASFVSAVMESYEYYNQCRFYARRIATESSTNVDEYTILQTHINAQQSAAKADESDQSFKEKLSDHLDSTYEKSFSSFHHKVLEFILEELSNYDLPTGFPSITEFLKVSTSVSYLQREVEEKFMIEASKAIMVFGYLMNEFATSDAPFSSMEMPELDTNFSFDRLEGIVRKVVIDFATHAKFEPIEDSKSVHQLDIEMKFGNEFAQSLCDLLGDACQAIYVRKPARDLNNFMLELRKPGENPEMKEFEREDLKLKRALEDCNDQLQQKKENHLVLNEFISSIHKTFKGQRPREQRDILKMLIKHGYPMPIDAIQLTLTALSRILMTNVAVKINKRKYGMGEVEIELDPIDDTLFLSNHDFMRFKRIGSSSQSDGQNVNDSLFESLQKRFPSLEILRDREILRSRLLDLL